MDEYLNLTAWMVRLTKARADRLRATVYVAPGRAGALVKAFHGRDIRCWEHSDTTVRVEDPLSVLELYERIGTNLALVPLLKRYCELRSFLRPGQKRPPSVVSDLEDVIRDVLEKQGD